TLGNSCQAFWLLTTILSKLSRTTWNLLSSWFSIALCDTFITTEKSMSRISLTRFSANVFFSSL
ncbi:hypothetical protein C0991_001780, partial [Blastosporella zonata]